MTFEIGEKEYLAKLGKRLNQSKGLAWRDDCIITPIGNNKCLVYSIDHLEPIHNTGNRKKDMRCFGRWSAAVTANDVIACGTIPKGISFDVGIKGISLEDFDNWVLGVQDVCKKYDMKYEGGNMNNDSNVSGVAWGIANECDILRRSGAKNGDILLATAAIGTGWAIKLWYEKNQDKKEQLREFNKYQDEPCINLEAFKKIWDLKTIRSSMDLTDGIIEFGYEIFEQSGFGVMLSSPLKRPFPINFVAKQLGLPIESLLLEPGYDTPFSHGWCIDPANVLEVTKILDDYKMPYTIIGRVDSSLDGVYFKTHDNKMINLPRYWDDVLVHRGSIQRWEEDILNLF